MYDIEKCEKIKTALLLILIILIISGCCKCPGDNPTYDKDGYCTGEDDYGNEWEYNY